MERKGWTWELVLQTWGWEGEDERKQRTRAVSLLHRGQLSEKSGSPLALSSHSLSFLQLCFCGGPSVLDSLDLLLFLSASVASASDVSGLSSNILSSSWCGIKHPAAAASYG